MSGNWLSYKKIPDPKKTDGGRFLISIPKKIVPLATNRNRLRRLIKEAIRQIDFPKPSGFLGTFRVHRFPGSIKLDVVLNQLKQL